MGCGFRCWFCLATVGWLVGLDWVVGVGVFRVWLVLRRVGFRLLFMGGGGFGCLRGSCRCSFLENYLE